MAKSNALKMKLPSVDDLFSTEESRQEAKLAKIYDIPISEIDDFPDHPFKVRDDEDTIAFPAISTGVYGYPKEEAAFIALTTVSSWLSENPDYGMAVVISCFDDEMRIIYQNVIDACAPGKENK